MFSWTIFYIGHIFSRATILRALEHLRENNNRKNCSAPAQKIVVHEKVSSARKNSSSARTVAQCPKDFSCTYILGSRHAPPPIIYILFATVIDRCPDRAPGVPTIFHPNLQPRS